MFGTATIVFREILEVALVLGIVLAATRGLPKRTHMVLLGVGIGIVGSAIIAYFTDTISEMVDGVGQEVFNAGIMFVAVAFLSWTVIWMKTHGRELARHINEVGAQVVSGNKSMYVLVGVIALTTFREGAEIVLFTYGQLAMGTPMFSVMTGGLIGAVSGIIVGFMLYFGLLTAVKRHLFTVTSWMLIILSAGMAAQGANFLIQAGILPELYSQVWDTSWLLDGGSFIGETLGVLVGYTARPSAMELIFYVSVLVTVGLAYKLVGRPKKELAQTDAVPAE